MSAVRNSLVHRLHPTRAVVVDLQDVRAGIGAERPLRSIAQRPAPLVGPLQRRQLRALDRMLAGPARVDLDPVLLVRLQVELLHDGVHRAGRDAGPAVDADGRVDVGPQGVGVEAWQVATQSV